MRKYRCKNWNRVDNRERCDCCGRFKVYNTGGGLICTNLRCINGISIEDDLREVEKLRLTESQRYDTTL